MPDFSVFVAPACTALLTALGVYISMTKQVTTIEVEIRNLTRQVEKHNSVVERTYNLETKTETAFMRIDELRGDLKSLRAEVEDVRVETAKIGGTD